MSRCSNIYSPAADIVLVEDWLKAAMCSRLAGNAQDALEAELKAIESGCSPEQLGDYFAEVTKQLLQQGKALHALMVQLQIGTLAFLKAPRAARSSIIRTNVTLLEEALGRVVASGEPLRAEMQRLSPLITTIS